MAQEAVPDPPAASSQTALRRMERQARRDTGPELALRRGLHRLGLRYRVDQPVPGLSSRRRADIVFGPARVAVFVDGCFWHRCPTHGSLPFANRDWWRDKLQANVQRDRDTDSRLHAAGWLPIRVWEHEDPDAAAARIVELVKHRRTQLRPDRPEIHTKPAGG